MSEIALYNALTKLGLKPEEAKEAVADVANSREVATKADLKAALAEQETRLIEKIADAKHTMIMWFVGVGIAILLAVLLK